MPKNEPPDVTSGGFNLIPTGFLLCSVADRVLVSKTGSGQQEVPSAPPCMSLVPGWTLGAPFLPPNFGPTRGRRQSNQQPPTRWNLFGIENCSETLGNPQIFQGQASFGRGEGSFQVNLLLPWLPWQSPESPVDHFLEGSLYRLIRCCRVWRRSSISFIFFDSFRFPLQLPVGGNGSWYKKGIPPFPGSDGSRLGSSRSGQEVPAT